MFLNQNLKAAILIAALVMFSFTPFARGAETGGAIVGIVKNKSGEPVAGATVKVTHVDRGLTVTVFSRAQGRYTATNLPAGKYTVQGLGGGFQGVYADPKGAVEVGDSQTVTADLALTTQQDFREAMTTALLAGRMPEGDGKTLIVSLCTDCHPHGLYEIVSRRMDRDDWMAVVEKMRSRPYGITRSLQIPDEDRDVVVDYLAKHFGPASPPLDTSKLPDTWVTGPAANSVFTEFEIPAGASAHDVAVDSKGIGWVSEGGYGVIGRYDPNSYTYSRFPLPGGKSSATAIAVDGQDRVWVSDGRNNRLVQFDPRTETFTSYNLPVPPGGRANANVIRFHPNGTVWMTIISANRIMRLDPAMKKVDTWLVPAGVAAKTNVNPYGMAIAPNGMIWFAERRSDKVAQIEPRTGEITEYDIPTKGAVLRRMAADVDGNLWFGEFGGVGKLAMIDYRTAEITEYSLPTKYSGGYSVDVDRTRNLIWVNEMMADQIARFDPRTKTFVEYHIPSHYSSVRRIAVDPSRPSRVWYTAFYLDKVGYLDVLE